MVSAAQSAVVASGIAAAGQRTHRSLGARERGAGREGRVRLVSIDITGRNEREIVTPTDASDPAWSPLIPRDAPGGGPDVR